MPTTAWPTTDMLTGDPLGREHYDPDRFLNEDRTTSLLRMIRVMAQGSFAVDFPATTSDDAGDFVEIARRRVYVPDFWAGHRLQAVLLARVTLGTGQWRLVDVDSGTATSPVNVSQTVLGPSGPITLVVDPDWTDTRRELAIEAKAPVNGDITLDSGDRLTWWVVD